MSNEQKEISTQRGKKKKRGERNGTRVREKEEERRGKNGGKRGEKNTYTHTHGKEREREKYRCTLALKSVGAIENCSFSEIRTAAGKSFADLE